MKNKQTVSLTLVFDVEVDAGRKASDVKMTFLNAVAAEVLKQEAVHPASARAMAWRDETWEASTADIVEGGLPGGKPIFEVPDALPTTLRTSMARGLTKLLTRRDLTDEDERALFRMDVDILLHLTKVDVIVQLGKAIDIGLKAPKNDRAVAVRKVADALIRRFTVAA